MRKAPPLLPLLPSLLPLLLLPVLLLVLMPADEEASWKDTAQGDAAHHMAGVAYRHTCHTRPQACQVITSDAGDHAAEARLHLGYGSPPPKRSRMCCSSTLRTGCVHFGWEPASVTSFTGFAGG